MTRKHNRSRGSEGADGSSARAPSRGLRSHGSSGWVWPALLVLAGIVVFGNSLWGVFIFDDVAIVERAQQQLFWPPWHLLEAAADTPVAGRPVVALTLALNHLVGGLDVRGYHAFNIGVHILCALALFGIVRRALRMTALGESLGAAPARIAFACALLWLVHPLQTEVVDYVSQRTESVMALFYLVTLYAAIRALDSERWGWSVAAVASCALGMASKEVMVTAPLMVLLFDATIPTRSFRELLPRRWPLYAGLAATWLILGALVVAAPRTQTAGFSTDVGVVQYALNQFPMIVRYLALVVWPHPLVIDYGTPRAMGLADVLPSAVIVVALLVATVYALIKRPMIGFLCAWFFVIIAPSSSIIPIATEVGAERRMYLPLAGLVVLAVVFVLARLPRAARRAVPYAAAAVVVALGLRSVARNADYRDDEVLWRSDIAHRPQWRAYYNLGEALERKGLPGEAVENLRTAYRLAPDALQTIYRLALALDRANQLDEAVKLYREYLGKVAGDAVAHNLFGTALARQGKATEAILQFRIALRTDPGLDDAHANLGASLQEQKEYEESAREYELFLAANPNDANIHNSLGVTLALMGKVNEAVAHFDRAVKIDPKYAVAHLNLGRALLGLGRNDDALEHLAEAMRLNPTLKDAVADAMKRK